MDVYRVIRHPGDEDEGARWAFRARQQRGPVEIISGPAPAVLRLGRTWLSASTGGMTEESYATLSWNQLPAKFKDERRFRGRCIGSREGFFLLLTGMPRPLLGVSCTTSIKDFAIFLPHQKKKKKQ